MMNDDQPIESVNHSLPTIPTGWCWARVGEIGDVKLGRQRSPEHHSGTHMRPYLRVANVYEDRLQLDDVLWMNFTPVEFEQYQLRHGDILLNEGQSLEWVGRPAMYRGEMPGVCFQNTLVRFRPHECVDGKFALLVFRYYLHSRRFQKIARWTVNIAHLGSSRFAEVEFPVPPLPEQERIVGKTEELLTDLDVAEATLRRVKAKLKRYRASVLKAAIDGKLTAEWRRQHPTTEPATTLLERILAERRRHWGDSQRAKYAAAEKTLQANWQAKYTEPVGPDTNALLPLPGGWCLTSVDALLRESLRNGHSAKESADGKGIRTLTLSAVTYGDFSEANTKITVANPDAVSDLWLRRDDILVERSNTPELVGISRIFKGSDGFAIFPDLLIRVRVSDQVLPDYVARVMQASPARAYFRLRAKGLSGSMPKIDQDTILKLAVPLPPLAEQAEIVREIEARLTVVDQVAAQIDANLKRAGRLRQGILKRAFEGKLVPQDATDEPASVLLERIRQQCQAAPSKPARKVGGGKLVRAVLENVGRAIAYCLSRAKKPHGRTWLAKVLAIGELHVGIPFKQRHGKYPHGPFDNMIYKAERVARKAGWFDFTEQAKAKEQTSYVVTAGTPAAALLSAEFFGDHKAKFDELLDHFDDLNSDEAELFATVYAAWNDLLIDGHPADEDAIVSEFFAWDESKKKFSRDQILSRIAWMRQHGYVPAGRGQRTTVLEKKTKPPSGRKKQPRKA